MQKFIVKIEVWSRCRHIYLQSAYKQQGIKGSDVMIQDELNVEKSVCNKKLKELQNEDHYCYVGFL